MATINKPPMLDETGKAIVEELQRLTAVEGPCEGAPTGGLKGQVLAKASDTDRDTEWIHVAPVIKNTASGAIASFPDGADGHPVDELKVQVEPVQEGSGDPSPDNIRPITGWTEAKLIRTGKNFLPCSGLTQTTNGITWTVNRDKDGNVLSIVADGTATGNSDFYFVGSLSAYEPIEVKNGQYVFTLLYNDNNIIPYVVRSDGRFVNTRQNIQFDLDAAEKYRIFVRANNGTTLENAVLYPMIRFSSESSTDYKPYAGQTYDIAFPTEAGTVYGGKLDVISGELAVDRATIDLASLTWTTYGTVGTNRRIVSNVLPNALAPSANNVKGDFITEQYKTVVYSQLNYLDFSQIAMALTGVLMLGFDNVNYPSGKICYKLAEPITYTLTPTEIRTLLGQNNIWADTGDVTVKYNADTKTYVNSKEHEVPVQDVQVNGTSVLSEGVANVPAAQLGGAHGTVKLKTSTASSGLTVDANGYLSIAPAQPQNYHIGTSSNPMTIYYMKYASFYGLARAAGLNSDINAAGTYNAVGTYTESAKSAISEMLGGAVEISGTTPSITGMAGVRYVCGEVSTLDIIAPATGCIDVTFTSGSTPTALTVTSAKANTTIKWANGFDPSALDADTVYEINILDGEFGVVGAWT